jgi:SAM-dependent methyltransferase
MADRIDPMLRVPGGSPPSGPPAAYAALYDVLYAEPGLLDAQTGYVIAQIGPPPARVLDAGCGTGRLAVRLAREGYAVVGLDRDPAMLRVAAGMIDRPGGAAPPRPAPASLVCGDLRALPFGGGFDALLCLDSPLAFLQAGEELAAALAGFRRVLAPGGRLVVEIYDYEASSRETGSRPDRLRRAFPGGAFTLREWRRHDRAAGLWEMRQAFTVRREGAVERFEVTHRLRLRTPAELAGALEGAGFAVRELLPAYPGAPPGWAGHRWLIVAAQAR